ncbi:MAG TPA: three-Cys-motif partner protein TcmP [Pyrinomonadaceae bacterium]|jgi:three-Cys-motif partner protein
MPSTPHLFGGDWTSEKLERVRKYLVAYATIMNRQKFRFAYVDAFAGTGYRTTARVQASSSILSPELLEDEPQEFLDGSARIALQVRPRFHKYIFIEQSSKRFAELEKLKLEFPELAEDILLENTDANSYLKDLCLNRNWKTRRAVLFLDPYGMQVTWDVIEAIASTRAIDLWILFPHGVAVNRMMTKDGKINAAWRRKLNMIFGETAWFNEFYQVRTETDLFGAKTSLEKVGNLHSIGQYFVKRLKTVFAGVVENPRPLYNSRNIPLYLLCFASGNPKGAPTAIKIAEDILMR